MPDNLTERLASLAANVDRSTRPCPAATVRARGDRRRTQFAAVAAGVVTAGVAVSMSAGVGGGGTPVGEPPLATTIPAGLTLPHQGEPGWTSSSDPLVPSVFNSCDDDSAPDVTLRGRTDARTATGRGNPVEEEHSPTKVTEQLFLYESEAAVDTVMADLSAAANSCGWHGGYQRGLIDSAWTNLVLSEIPDDQPDPPYRMLRLTAVSMGNAIFLRYADIGGALMVSGDPAAIAEMGRELCAKLGLCESPVPWCALGSPDPNATPAPPMTCPSGPVQSGSPWPGSPWPGESSVPVSPSGPVESFEPGWPVSPSPPVWPSGIPQPTTT